MGWNVQSFHPVKAIYPLCACLLGLLPLAGQDREPVISKETLSVHTVERGNMPLFEQATGSLTSLHPPRAVLALSSANGECKSGSSARIQVEPFPRGIEGKVLNGSKGGCEIELSDGVPQRAALGNKVRGLVQTGEMKDMVYFARPADSVAKGAATLFVLEPDSAFARRTRVQYGEISGPFIQIVEGLAPGDRVIVTDTSKWTGYPRVRIQ